MAHGVTNDGDSHADAPPTLGSDEYRHLGRTADQQHQRTAAAKRHLYLVLDDQKHEYGIYKLDVDADPDDVGSVSARLLPHPAVFRVEVPTAIEDVAARFAALGRCIVTLGCSPNTLGYNPEHCGVTYVYDTDTAALSVSCDGPKGLHYGYHDAVAVGGRLYAFESESEAYSWGSEPIRPYPGGMHCMSTVGRDGEDKPDTRWCWQPFSGSSRYFWSADILFRRHPDLLLRHDERAVGATGRLAMAAAVRDHRPPERKVGGEKMLLGQPGWSHVDAKLVHMSERGEYCLVERLRREGTNQEERLREGDECLLRLNTFRVKYGEDGELITATDRRHASLYRVLRYRDDFEVAAFWI
ncbi:unnamed protein product [Alopecurus aequalis]